MTLTEKDITSEVARQLRSNAGLTQKEFWEPIGVKQCVSSRYERDITIPKSVRILLVARYVYGIELDASHSVVDELKKLGAIRSKIKEAKRIATSVRGDIAKASKKLQDAHDALASI